MSRALAGPLVALIVYSIGTEVLGLVRRATR